MCRWMGYAGGSIPLESLLFTPKHNLIDQSMSSNSRETQSDGSAPTLYHTVDVQDVYAINPAIQGAFGEVARLMVSEPVGNFAEMWVPEGSFVTVRGASIETRAFGSDGSSSGSGASA